MVSRVGKANKKGFQPETETFFCDLGLESVAPVQLLWITSRAIASAGFAASVCWLHLVRPFDIPPGPLMDNQNERNLLRRAELMTKHRYIIAKAAREVELERERELERISKANRAAAVREQNLSNSNENERAMENRLAIRQELRFRKAARRAPRRAVNAVKKTVEIADGSSDFSLLMNETSKFFVSQTIFEDVTGLQLIRETEDDVREFLQSIN